MSFENKRLIPKESVGISPPFSRIQILPPLKFLYFKNIPFRLKK